MSSKPSPCATKAWKRSTRCMQAARFGSSSTRRSSTTTGRRCLVAAPRSDSRPGRRLAPDRRRGGQRRTRRPGRRPRRARRSARLRPGLFGALQFASGAARATARAEGGDGLRDGVGIGAGPRGSPLPPALRAAERRARPVHLPRQRDRVPGGAALRRRRPRDAVRGLPGAGGVSHVAAGGPRVPARPRGQQRPRLVQGEPATLRRLSGRAGSGARSAARSSRRAAPVPPLQRHALPHAPADQGAPRSRDRTLGPGRVLRRAVARRAAGRGLARHACGALGPGGRRAILGPGMRTYHLTTFGCQMNEHDSERMKGMLDSLGYSEVAERPEADLILFNTCSIREKADERFVAHLQEARALKKRDPERVIGVGGCWAQSMKEQVFRQFPFVDVAFGPGQVHKLAEFLTADSITAQGFFEFEGFTGHLPAKRGRDFQAWVQISAGCNMRCAFCIVPSTRGREVSRPLTELVSEAKRMAADGVREVTLLGQNVNSYGRDLRPDRRSFSELLRAVDAVDGIDRIRYTSPHPKDMREDVIRAHAELGALCEHIHLPLQSGSSPVLKAMRRTYNRERYLDRVALIRELVPDCALTTDIIVGFPGETDDDFEQTLEVCEEVGYDSAFTFLFSPRRGTEAANFTDGLVPHEVKVERMERLVEVVQRRATERAQRFVGRTLDVLVEGPSRTDPAKLRGRSRHNKTVNFTGLAAPGEIVPVTIHSATSTTLAGEESLLSRAVAA